MSRENGHRAEQEAARALSRIMRRKSIGAKKTKTPSERGRGRGKRVVRWVGDGSPQRRGIHVVIGARVDRSLLYYTNASELKVV